MGEPQFEYRDFTFRYRSQENPTLKKINLTIKNGEKLLLVGASGSGKSTLGNTINGLIPHSLKGKHEGAFSMNGVSYENLNFHEISKTVGTVLQDTDGQFVGLNVGEDIAFSLENDALPQKEMKIMVRQAAASVGMENFLFQSPFELSGGQKQRVSLAGVLVDDVDVLLFDEPLANLDPKTGQYAIELIDEIHQKTKKTIIIIEHRLEDVLHRPVDRIILMERGFIVAEKTPNQLLVGNLLKEKGLREPLYLAAMKHAGCRISPHDHPAYLETIQLDQHRRNLIEWGEKFPPEDTPIPSSPPLLRMEDISYSYDGKKNSVKNLSFAIHRGEIVSILGENGAGKSTLLQIIMGMLKPDSGKIFYEEKAITTEGMAWRSQKMGFVMQNPNHMISHDMIRDEVGFGLQQKGEDEKIIVEKTDHILELCGLYSMRKWPISALSYGQKKRVSIASILVMEPDLLILDEPTAGQDFRHYTAIMRFLKKTNENHPISILMVTHDLHLALEYSQRALVLSKGSVLADDSVSRVFSQKAIIEEASLKLTSLYNLAERLGINKIEQFIEAFIRSERTEQDHG